MTASLDIMLSQLEREYYDGVGFDRLVERVKRIAAAVQALDASDPLREVFESNAAQLWGADNRTPITTEAVHEALSGTNAADHLRAWSNFYKVLATHRSVA